MLKFFGSGGAFNTERGNNSAWLKCGRELFIFDMGGDVLPKMVRLNVFDKVARIHIFITHMHGDHVGGLGNALLYLHSQVLRQQPENICIYFPNPEIEKFLFMQGVERGKRYMLYTNRQGELSLMDAFPEKVEYSFEPTTHTPIFGENVFGIDLKIGQRLHIFYSGDSNRFNPKCLNIEDYTAVYHEISSDPESTAHFQYEDLLELTAHFTAEQKKKIHLMHISGEFDTERARADGFSVVENAQSE